MTLVTPNEYKTLKSWRKQSLHCHSTWEDKGGTGVTLGWHLTERKRASFPLYGSECSTGSGGWRAGKANLEVKLDCVDGKELFVNCELFLWNVCSCECESLALSPLRPLRAARSARSKPDQSTAAVEGERKSPYPPIQSPSETGVKSLLPHTNRGGESSLPASGPQATIP